MLEAHACARRRPIFVAVTSHDTDQQGVAGILDRPARASSRDHLGDAYRLERELGGGGMTRVFVAEELRLARRSSSRCSRRISRRGLSAERFEREIRTVAALQQANIVPVLTTGETDGLPYYTMPFVEGESLRARLANAARSRSPKSSASCGRAKALAYAHERGVVHRDIKPDNVLLSGGTAVVTDFGIAKAISAARTESDGGDAHAGRHVDRHAGVHGAGAGGRRPRTSIIAPTSTRSAAWRTSCSPGRPPFANRTPQRMLAAHMGEAPRPITELRPRRARRCSPSW